MCDENKNKGGESRFLWISIDHIEMMLISTYHLKMVFALNKISYLISVHILHTYLYISYG